MKNNLEKKLLHVDRVCTITKKGKVYSYRTLIVVGNFYNLVGIGLGKASSMLDSGDIAYELASTSLINVPVNKFYTIDHKIKAKINATEIFLFPSLKKEGIKSDPLIRTILNLSGIKFISTKQFGGSSKINSAKALILALKNLSQKKSNVKSILHIY